MPGLVAIALMPAVLYVLYPPELKRTPDATSFAREQLTAELAHRLAVHWAQAFGGDSDQ